MRRRGPRPVGVALEALTDAIVPATLLAEVQRVWPQAAGEAFARATEPVAERDGIVTVACDSAVWAQELDLFSERVVGALNEAIGRPAVHRLARVRCRPASERPFPHDLQHFCDRCGAGSKGSPCYSEGT